MNYWIYYATLFGLFIWVVKLSVIDSLTFEVLHYSSIVSLFRFRHPVKWKTIVDCLLVLMNTSQKLLFSQEISEFIKS